MAVMASVYCLGGVLCFGVLKKGLWVDEVDKIVRDTFNFMSGMQCRVLDYLPFLSVCAFVYSICACSDACPNAVRCILSNLAG